MRRALLLVWVVGCSEPSAATPPSVEDLPPGVVARVGSDDISSRGVGQVAAAQRITREQALDRMVADALFAAEARDRFPATVAAAERGAAARALLEELQRAARAAGPPTDTEVQQVTERRWWDLDRPPSVKVTHAVVRVKKPVDDSAARELAERIAKATVGAESAADFEKRATAVPANGLTVLVEHLPPVTEDGRVVPPEPPPPDQPQGRFEEPFARAANAIQNVGEQSGVVQTSYGYHVIYLEERLPEHRVPLEERRQAVEGEVIANRARAAETAILSHGPAVSIDRAAASLTGKVRIQ
ncbi:MAG: peptidyl-prolyl cis-trans isomerase [Myxococcales bacterium]|nr:peptidyl-prolyl cis-trans isomerase [Myxococcales bacterium]MCB9583218.1 peptidyl-prolyl cis-trans isomerase [Polyangiaceae bacterium]